MKKQPALRVENIGIRLFRRRGFMGRKTFSHWALDDVSFEVQKGEVFGVIGRNGAGKSSLLRVLAWIFEPDRGVVRSFGLKTCLLSIQTGFLMELTGRENATLGGMLLGKSSEEMKTVMQEIIDFSELDHWIDQPLSTYSSGMAARLGFSVAMNTEADIILIDEALSVGDQSFKAKCQIKMREVMGSDKTILLVSHSPGAIEEMTERAVWLEAGRSVLCDRSDVVAAAYKKFNERAREYRAAGEKDPHARALPEILAEIPAIRASLGVSEVLQADAS